LDVNAENHEQFTGQLCGAAPFLPIFSEKLLKSYKPFWIVSFVKASIPSLDP
jgi:hypothetical protein